MSLCDEIIMRELQAQKEREIANGLRNWEMMRSKNTNEKRLQVKLLLNAAEWMISTGSRLKNRAEKLSLQNQKSITSFSKGSC